MEVGGFMMNKVEKDNNEQHPFIQDAPIHNNTGEDTVCPDCNGTGAVDDYYESNGNGRLWCPGSRNCERCDGKGHI